jgi:predicted nicotinamide N-methyase
LNKVGESGAWIAGVMMEDNKLFTWLDGAAYYRELPVLVEAIQIAGRSFRIARVEDAAGLLDEADFAKRFLEDDVAPYGLELWPSAIMLAEYLLSQKEGAGCRAVELGCGLGLVSIACAAAGWRVTATDNEATSLRFAEYNAQLNSVEVDGFETLDWRHPPTDQQFERVLAADVLYQLVDHAPILQCIKTLLAPGGRALIADPHRGVADRFPEMASAAGFDVNVIPAAAALPGGKQVSGRIFSLGEWRRRQQHLCEQKYTVPFEVG